MRKVRLDLAIEEPAHPDARGAAGVLMAGAARSGNPEGTLKVLAHRAVRDGGSFWRVRMRADAQSTFEQTRSWARS